jgi:hypothetical protein
MKLTKIHEDERGEIWLLEGFEKYPEVTLFKTNAGYARGGCIHNINDEFTCVLEGDIVYFNGNDREFLTPGCNTIILKGTPHYYISVTDSVVLEWGATPEEKKEKHPQFREIVNKINKKT